MKGQKCASSFLRITHNLTAYEATGATVPIHIIKACKGRRGTAPLILNFGTRWRWEWSGLAPSCLAHRETAPGTSGHFGEKKKPFIFPGIKPQTIQSKTLPLHQLSYPSS